jgi:hypothetical protein
MLILEKSTASAGQEVTFAAQGTGMFPIYT